MSRYENTRMSRNKKNNALSYDTTLYADVPESNTDIYVISQHGDRLDSLAYEYYGDTSLWWFIGNINNITTMNLEPGTRLRISFDIVFARGLVDHSQ